MGQVKCDELKYDVSGDFNFQKPVATALPLTSQKSLR
jgi:hypothetical protein